MVFIMIKMKNPDKPLKYHIVVRPISRQLKIISDIELDNYKEILIKQRPYLEYSKYFIGNNFIHISFIGDLKYAKYNLFKCRIESLTTDKQYFIKWNSKPNCNHSQRYYDEYYNVLRSFDKQIEKLTKLVIKYENENPYMIL